MKLIKLLKKPVVAIFLSILLGVVVGGIVFVIAGFNPIESYFVMIKDVIFNPRNLAQVVVNSVPLIFTALAFSFTSQAGLFNIGIEGQFVFGALTAAMVGAFLPLPKVIHPIVILICAFIIGGLWGALSGLLKAKFGIHEVISTIMLNWIAHYFNNFVVNLPSVKVPATLHSKEIMDTAIIKFFSTEWRRSEAGREFIMEHPILGDIVRSDLGFGVFIAIIVAIILWFVLKHTTKGYEVRAVGLNKDAAEFSGIPVEKNIVFTMFISGAVAALGGAILVMTTSEYVSVLAAQEGYGWDGMSVALIGNTNPIGVLPAGLFFAALRLGGNAVQSRLGAPTEIINIIIGVIVLAIAAATLLPRFADNLLKKRRELKREEESE